ncbi:hypothetical protein [Dongia rigui]|uniref:Lipoprotein n=1 Tax=Dongia rigui TaxID=940149 RepID=A0ABU5E0M2_9PROT|nr:hypothetical protein [Dongia rigui]MDY0873141.1 hypothetical protein [Dongia rigui]
MKTQGFISSAILILLAILAAGCQSAPAAKPPAKAAAATEALRSLEGSAGELEALLTLLQELKAEEGNDAPPSFPELDARKERATSKLGILLLASCLGEGEDISKLADTANPPCVSHGISKLLDPSGGVDAHCAAHKAIEPFVSCAAGGIMISRMKSYMHQDVTSEDWTDSTSQAQDVAHDLAGYVVNGCLKASKGIADCIVVEFADALDVRETDTAYCRKQSNLSDKLYCLGAAAAVGLLENGAATGS